MPTATILVIRSHRCDPLREAATTARMENGEAGLDDGGELLDYDEADSLFELGEQVIDGLLESETWALDNPADIEDDDFQEDENLEKDSSSGRRSGQCYWCDRAIERGGFPVSSLGIVCGAACRDRPGVSQNRLAELASYRRINLDMNPVASPRCVQPHSPFAPTAPTSLQGVRWTRDEESRLVNSWRTGDSLSELAVVHKRTIGGVSSRLRVLGKIEIDNGASHVPPSPFEPHRGLRKGERWSAGEENHLLASWRSNKTVIEMAEAHGRTVNAIKSRLVRIGVIESEDEADAETRT